MSERPKGDNDPPITSSSSKSYKDDGIGLEDTRSDFEDLLDQASSLSPAEARAELLDCARHGETDAVRAILDVHQQHDDPSAPTTRFVDTTDESQTTPLHKSCANGHALTTRLLLSRGAQHLPNSSGNTPLHWAAANGHTTIVKLLLSEPRFKAAGGGEGDGEGGVEGSVVGDDTTTKMNSSIDVLKKNEFGRSSLTEGFSSEKTELVGLLLEHDSAAEERLLGGVKKEEVDAKSAEVAGMGDVGPSAEDGGSVGTADTGSSGACVIHEFDFRRTAAASSVVENGDVNADDGGADPNNDDDDDANGRSSATAPAATKTLLIRELPIAHADDPFGSKAEDDTTGLGIWCASLVAARWVASPSVAARFDGRTVLELGAGCGVPGLAAALYSNARSVYLTDLNPATIRNMQYNIDLNKDGPETTKGTKATVGDWSERVTASAIDWGNESTWPTEKLDFVIGSDLIYQSTIVPLLIQVVTGLLKPEGGTFLYVCPEDGRDGLSEFIKRMTKEKGFTYVSNTIAPDVYRENPLSNGDDEDCFLHFHELGGTTYVLHEFTRR